MTNYIFNEDYKTLDQENLWNKLISYVENEKSFKTATGQEYDVELRGNSIFYKGGKGSTRRATEGEAMLKIYILKALSIIQTKDSLSTSSIKKDLETEVKPLHSKFAQFLGLVHAADILQRKE